jgi:hypothetical protein
MPVYIERSLPKDFWLIMEWTIMEFAEALVFIGMLRWNFVRELEEEEVERFSQNKVKAGCLDSARTWLGFRGTMKGVSGHLHLLESMYD